MSFHPPTDENGRTLSYEEYCERAGVPFNDRQKAARKAYADWLAKVGEDRLDNWDEAKHYHYEIQAADDERLADARATGWEWPK